MYLFFKRLFDIICSLIAVIILAIPLAVLALLVKLSSKGPAIHWSNRIGKNNKVFKMAKFRTMRIDTPQLATHLLTEPEKWITPIGLFLRKYSLDELPQVWNILKGDISFVGPRPALFNQEDLTELRTKKGIHKIKPGISGWAQINGRDELPIHLKVEYDEYYLKNRSIWFDFQILLLTFIRVLGSEGVDYPKNVVFSSYRYRLLFVILSHAVFSGLALFAAFLLRFEFTLGGTNYPALFYKTLPVCIACFVFFSATGRLFHRIWRYFSVDDLRDIIKASALASLSFVFLLVLTGAYSGYPRSIYLMTFLFFILFNAGSRFMVRFFGESFSQMSLNTRNVLIVGAGRAGIEVARSLNSMRKKEYLPAGFIDNDKSLHGKRIEGLKILGDLTALRTVVAKHRIHELFIAIPNAQSKTIKSIMDAARLPSWDIKFRIIPSIVDIMSGKFSLNQVRDVTLGELINRESSVLPNEQVRRMHAAKTVMVTGAGGFTGREFCRQVAECRPARLIMVDISEEDAYHIDMECKSRFPDTVINTVVCDVLETGIMDLVLKKYKPDSIIHTAVYKNRTLMEADPAACIKNNIIGTANLASLAERHGVSNFLLVTAGSLSGPANSLLAATGRIASDIVLNRSFSKTVFNTVQCRNFIDPSSPSITAIQKNIENSTGFSIDSAFSAIYPMSVTETVCSSLACMAVSRQKSGYLLLKETGDASIKELILSLMDIHRLEHSLLTLTKDNNSITGLSDAEKTDIPFVFTKHIKDIAPETTDGFIHQLKSLVDLRETQKALELCLEFEKSAGKGRAL